MWSKNRTNSTRTSSKDTLLTYQREVLSIVSAALFVFLFLACISYCSTDPSFLYFTTQKASVKNWCGPVGAYVAAFLFFVWGSVTYLFLAVVAAFVGMALFHVSFKKESDRLIASFFLLLAAAVWCRMYNLQLVEGEAGGMVGYALETFLHRWFNQTGTKLFVWAALLANFVWATRFSFIAFMTLLGDSIAYFSQQVFDGIKAYLPSFVRFLSHVFYVSVKALFHSYFKKEKIHRQETSPKESSLGVAQQSNVPFSELMPFSDDVMTNQDVTPPFMHSTETKSGGGHLALHGEDEKGASATPCEEQGDVSIDAIEGKDEKRQCVYDKSRFFFVTRNKSLRILANSVLNAAMHERLKNFWHSKPGPKKYVVPDVHTFIPKDVHSKAGTVQEEHKERGRKLEEKLERFGIKGHVKAIRPGPVITVFEYEPEIDTKISKIIALEDDLALALTALSMRIVAPIPGRNVIGFEIANQHRQSVLIGDVLDHEAFTQFKGALPIILGVNSSGQAVVQDLAHAPHLLVAGSTGSGKSVGLNVLLFSLLCKLSPDELKLILIDPKRLEFAPYADIPHLLFPVVTNPHQAAPVLLWVAGEMERRYETMARAGVRNVVEYQQFFKKQTAAAAPHDFQAMPYLVVIIDELADLMMVAGKEVEVHIARIAQMARAAGIHLVVATQRPSVDVLTGVIKVNFPSRMAFRVSSKIDSRTIIDSSGAEKLLGRGDMLYLHAGSCDLARVHGAYVSDEQIQKLADYARSMQKPEYIDLREVHKQQQIEADEQEDDLYDQVLELIKTKDEISISLLQRHFRIGFNRSARLIEKLELDGLIAPAQGSKPRKILR